MINEISLTGQIGTSTVDLIFNVPMFDLISLVLILWFIYLGAKFALSILWK